MTHWTLARVCVPTYMRNTYPGVGSVLRAIIACRPEDSLRPVLSYPSSSLAIVPRQTHDHIIPPSLFVSPICFLVLDRVKPLPIPIAFLSLSLSLSLEEESTCRILFSFGFSSLTLRTLAFPKSSVVCRSIL